MKKVKVMNKKSLRTMIIGVVTVAVAVVCAFLYVSRPTELDKLSQSYLDTVDVEKLQKKVEKDFESSYQLKDYIVYGETLSLYKSAYGTAKTDKMQGNNIVLRNVMNDAITSFTFNGKVDSGIDLGSLKEGVYELYTYNHYEKERIYFDKAFKAKTITTMRRNKKVKDIMFIADKDALKKQDIQLDKNYAFLIVTKHIPKSTVYDVVIDPCGNTMDYTSDSVDYGTNSTNLDEASTSIKFARKVKKKLEEKGLKVKILRKENESPGYYGADGRPARGYSVKAKVYLALGVCEDENAYAPYMVTSPYTNSGLANTVSYVMANKGLSLYPVRTNNTQNMGVLYDAYIDGNNGSETKYELYPQLRETGGRATYTGLYGDEMKNTGYKKAYGMYGLYFVYASTNNSESVTYYKKNVDALAKALAKGIVIYFEV